MLEDLGLRARNTSLGWSTLKTRCTKKWTVVSLVSSESWWRDCPFWDGGGLRHSALLPSVWQEENKDVYTEWFDTNKTSVLTIIILALVYSSTETALLTVIYNCSHKKRHYREVIFFCHPLPRWEDCCVKASELLYHTKNNSPIYLL